MKRLERIWMLFWGTLQPVLIVLKLIGVIKWSWWWVMLPLWGNIVLGLGYAGLKAGLNSEAQIAQVKRNVKLVRHAWLTLVESIRKGTPLAIWYGLLGLVMTTVATILHAIVPFVPLVLVVVLWKWYLS